MHRKATNSSQFTFSKEVHGQISPNLSGGYASLSDEILVQSALLGDENAYTYLFNRYKKKIYFICVQYCSGDRDKANDCCQEAYISAFNNLDKLRDKSQFVVWLIEIAKNKCISFARKQKTFDKVMREYQVIEDISIKDKNVYTEATYQLIEELVESLKNDDVKDTIKLFYMDGKKTTEIAKLQKITQTTVTSRLNRFRTTFRRRIIIEVLEQQESDS